MVKAQNLCMRIVLLGVVTSAWMYSANIIFDLGGVLLNTNKMVTAKKAGLFSIPLYAIFHFKNPRTALFELLNSVEPFSKTIIKPCDELGHELPDIMCDWLKGVSSRDIREKVRPYAKNAKPLWNMVKAIFDPETFAESQTLIHAGADMVDHCIAQGHKVYILSNWDNESFGLIQQQYPEFFDKFSGIVLSGECGIVKPDPEIYKYLLSEYDLDASTCFFIDNQQENIAGAQSVGIKGALLTATWTGKLNFAQVQDELHVWLADKKSNKSNNKSSKQKK